MKANFTNTLGARLPYFYYLPDDYNPERPAGLQHSRVVLVRKRSADRLLGVAPSWTVIEATKPPLTPSLSAVGREAGNPPRFCLGSVKIRPSRSTSLRAHSSNLVNNASLCYMLRSQLGLSTFHRQAAPGQAATFGTTRWSVVLTAGRSGGKEAREALATPINSKPKQNARRGFDQPKQARQPTK